jgi:hypothetical protein
VEGRVGGADDVTALLNLAIVAIVVLSAALVVLGAPSHWLLGLYFLSQLWQGTWSAGGVLLDSADVALALIVLSMAVRGVPRDASPRKTVPHLVVWLGLVALLAAAYAVSPDGRPHMTDPPRIAYQLYRYGVRFAILYPIAWLLLNTGRRFDQLVVMIVLVADVFAIMSFGEGYAGHWATGPFETKNGLGAALAVPVVLVFTDLLSGRRSVLTVVGLVSAPLLLRSALFASSRGAFAGMVVGTLIAGACMLRGRVHARVGAFVVAAVVALPITMIIKPDLFERPTIVRLLDTVDLQGQTFVWRNQKIWPHFARRALEHPWLGWGTNVDPSLLGTTNTPHSGYLSLAVQFGMPVLALYLFFCGVTLRDASRVVSRSRDPADRIRAAKIAGGIACILTHNIVDTVITIPFVGGELWVLVAVAARLAARAREPNAARAPSAAPPAAMAVGA